MAPLRASWRKIADEAHIQRSSQILSIAEHDDAEDDQALYVFGGELKPREPVDNKLYRVALDAVGSEQNKVHGLDAESAPSPRVGSASTTLNGKTYLFSGRGGVEMAPIEEKGALHVLDTRSTQWSTITPADPNAKYPPARSYHTLASDNVDTLFLHAGCPEKGRLADLWAFSISSRRWTLLAEAPGPARGGTSTVFCGGKLYRMNGFDGKNELGYSLDVYDPENDCWTSKTWADGAGPEARSVATLLAAKVDGKDVLLTMFGERDPSNLGHQGAGKMLEDVWAYDIAEETWKQVEAEGNKPQPRGWFAAVSLKEKNKAAVHGGLAEDNSRLGDVWVLSF